MITPIEKLKEAYEAERVARLRMASTMEICFPIGSSVAWKRGRGVQFGTVVHSASWAAQIIVRNDRTGREVKIGAYEILSAVDGDYP